MTIKANITDNNGAVESGSVIIVTDDENYTADIENGVITKDVILSTSPSVVKIVYEGSDINLPVNASTLVKLEKLNSNITVTQIASEDANSIINVEVYGEDGRIIDNETVRFVKNNELLSTVTLNNSKGQFISQLDEGSIITAMYRGNNRYNPVSTNITIRNMTKYLKVDEINANVGDVITITARIEADNETLTDVNKGKVTFKVNGKTLKDTYGKVIYAKVTNGIATIDNFEVPESWNREDIIIQAVYSGSSEYVKLTSEKQAISINSQETKFTTEDVTTTVGSTITLTATITAATPVNTGKVVFKVNGKTVKDVNGKTIYAKVANGVVSVNYTLPANMKAGSYNITAVYTSNNYGQLTDTKVLTVN